MDPIVDIFEYDNYRDYLSSMFKERQKKNPRYSMRKFSKDLGFSSPNHVTDLIKGEKNIGRLGVEKILSGITLGEKSGDYFRLLVDLSRVKSPAQRHAMRERFKALHQRPQAFVNRDKYSYYVSNRMCSTISTLIEIYGKEFSADPVWIMRRVKIKTSVFEVSSALVFMIRSGFVVLENGHYVNGVSGVFSQDGGIATAVKSEAQTRLFEEAKNALDFSPDKTEFLTVNLALSDHDLTELKTRCQRFFAETSQWLLRREKEDSSGPEKGVSINLQLYPICGDE